MQVNKKLANELVAMARGFNHTLLPKKGKQIMEVSAEFLADLVGRVEYLEKELEKRR